MTCTVQLAELHISEAIFLFLAIMKIVTVFSLSLGLILVQESADGRSLGFKNIYI